METYKVRLSFVPPYKKPVGQSTNRSEARRGLNLQWKDLRIEDPPFATEKAQDRLMTVLTDESLNDFVSSTDGAKER